MDTMSSYLENSNLNHNPISVERCRICLRETTKQDMDSLFEQLQDGFSIAFILENVSNIKIEKEEHMPNSVCRNCSKVILDFQYLVKTFYNSEEFLRNCLIKNGEFEVNKKNIVEMLVQDVDSCDRDSLLLNDENVSNCSDSGGLFDQDEDEPVDDDVPLSSLVTKRNSQSDTFKTEIDEKVPINEIPGRHTTIRISTDFPQAELFDNADTKEIPSTKYTCEICGDCFLFKSGFGHHMLMVHNICIQVSQYEDYSSQITIKVPKGLPDVGTKYARKCNPPIPLYKTEIQCKKCKEIFETGEALKEHIEVHKTFKCDQCGAAFIKNSYLRDHLLKHSAAKCYSCKDCGQAFKYRSALAVHRREHIGTNTGHMCESCGKNFKERGTLKTHIMLKHTNERKFPCSSCDLTFKLKAARDKHYMRKHTSNRTKDFVCSMCGMAYLNKETLTRHMTEKHTGTPICHWCTVCQKSFTMKSNLSKHLRNKHNVITKKE